MSQTKAQLIDPVDGTIVNADINASAAIAGSKISPNFGSQNITTTGNITSSAGEISTTNGSLVANKGTNNQVVLGHDGAVEISRNGGGAFIDFKNDPSEDHDARIQENNGGFDISGNVNIASGCDVTGAITGTGDLTIDTNTLHVDSSNNRVGIGTASPEDSLHLKSGKLRIENAIVSNNDSTISYDNADFIVDVDPNNVRGSSSFQVKIDTVVGLTVDDNRRLLIGHTTSLPAANAEFSFQVLGTSFATTSVTQQRYADDVSGPSIILAKSRGSLGNHTIVNNGDELGKIRFYGSDGNDFNNYGAEIKAQCDGTPGNNDMPGRLVFSTTADGAASPTERMRIDSSGNILFGTTSVGGNTHAYFEAATQNRRILHIGCSTTGTSNVVIFRNPNNAVGSIQTSGSTTIYSTSSDYRLKENAVAISDGITRLKTLKPYRFNFKADADKTVDGFFAHEVTAVPEAISGTKDEVVTQAMIDAGDYKEGTLNDPIYQGIDQSKLVPLLVAAVQELITKVETLEAA
jgi:hypothetical protein